MSSDDSTLSVSSIKRFPAEVREELNRFLRQSSWQRMNKELSIEVLTGLKAEALDNIADLVDSDYHEFQKDVRKRVGILKRTRRGKTQSFKGKSDVGFHSYFYRFWLVGQHNAEDLYDIVFCHICRTESIDSFAFLEKTIQGGTHTLALVVAMINELPPLVMRYLGWEKKQTSLEAASGTEENQITNFVKYLGDYLVEHELVEDLIERGILKENDDGTLYIRLR